MTAYLREHKPRRTKGQFRTGRRFDRSPTGHMTGVTGLHTAEGVMDTVGVDTGAENVARFVQQRTDAPGSYHHIVDSDSVINLVDLDDEAYADGTGSNPWATSLSFACKTTDWARMTPERRAAFMRHGALAFAAQQSWRKARGYALTELRLITKAQSDRGESGFVYHGVRDAGRRTDPGTTAAAPFPLSEFLAACRDATASKPVEKPAPPNPAPAPPAPAPTPEDDMFSDTDRTKLEQVHQQLSRWSGTQPGKTLGQAVWEHDLGDKLDPTRIVTAGAQVAETRRWTHFSMLLAAQVLNSGADLPAGFTDEERAEIMAAVGRYSGSPEVTP